MKFLTKITFTIVMCCFINIAVLAETDGLYTATTADGVELKIRRYRPTSDANFNEGRQPVLLFPGLMYNMNGFTTHTPEARQKSYAGIELPEDHAEWADGDPYIEEDPMKYYAMAHYLWLKGYDPWVANYRGIGRRDMRSGTRWDVDKQGNSHTNIDIWGVFDVPACVDKVVEETGLDIVMGGHSTGAYVTYIYLQGCYMDVDEFDQAADEKWVPHVNSDPALAAERNSKVKGFIALDPATVPPLPITNIIESYPIFYVLGQPAYFELDNLLDNIINPLIPTNTNPNANATYITMQLVFGSINTMTGLTAFITNDYWDIFEALNMWQPGNFDPYVVDYVTRYAFFSSFYMGVFGQYADSGVKDRIREHFKNGEENKNRILGKKPSEDDGYYYYDDNMYKVSVPIIAVFSERSSLVDTEPAVEILINGKTAHVNDEWLEIEGYSHFDVIQGYKAASITFPRVGAWIEKVAPAVVIVDSVTDSNTDDGTGSDSKSDDVTVPENESQAGVDIISVGQDAGGCGSAAEASITQSKNNPVIPGLISLLSMMLIPFALIQLRRKILESNRGH